MTLSAPPLNDLDHNHNDRDYQEDMYETSEREEVTRPRSQNTIKMIAIV